MKFHALALGVAGALVSGAAFADHNMMPTAGARQYEQPGVMSYQGTTYYHWPMTTRPTTGAYTIHRTVAGTFYTPAIYNDLPSIGEVGAKVSEIVTKQRQEVAMLSALAPRARTAGFDNIGTVYDVMIRDHQRIVGQGSNWLVSWHQPVPAEPMATMAADITPEASVDQQIDMHQQSFNEALDGMHNERSSTVRGLMLESASTAAHHISLLRTLDSDVEMGRKTVSARLNLILSPTGTSQTDLLASSVTEETEYWQAHNPPVVAYTPPPAPAPEVAQAPPPAPAPEVVPAPAPPIVATTPAPMPYIRPTPMRSRVAGRMQINRRHRRLAH